LNRRVNVDDCLDLMRKLIEYGQQKALHHQLTKAAERSMLGLDAIVMLYHCAKVSVGTFSRSAHTWAEHPSPWPWACGIQERKRKSSASSEKRASVQPAHYKEILPLSAILDPHH
jgi:hypothetical protein